MRQAFLKLVTNPRYRCDDEEGSLSLGGWVKNARVALLATRGQIGMPRAFVALDRHYS